MFHVKHIISLLLLVALISSRLQAQKDDKNLSSGIVMLGAGYGKHWVNLKPLNNGLLGKGFGKEIQSLSIHIGQPILASPGDQSHYFQYYLPQTSDPSKQILSGFNIGVTEGCDLLYKIQNFDLNLFIGMNTGRLKVVGDRGVQKYTNPFFCFNGGMEFRYNTNASSKGRGLSIGARGIYQHDVSQRTWREKKGDHPDLPGIKINGLSAQVIIGYYIHVL